MFVDRLKHLVRRAGENISAAEIEGVLTTSALVRQAAVVAARDPIREEEVVAFIVARDGANASHDLAREISVSAVNAWRRSSCRRGSPSSANCR